MGIETLTSPRRSVFAAITSSPAYQRISGTWLYRFIAFPIGQIIVFITIVSVIVALLAIGISLVTPDRNPSVSNFQLISLQLPGMLISGVTTGFVYAMIALGYTLVYGVLKFINFAHSEIFMVGSVVGFEIMMRIFSTRFVNEAGDTVSAITVWSPVTLVLVTVAGAALASGLLAVLIERVAYRPLRRAPRLVPLITAIGISFVLQDLVRAFESITRGDFNLSYPTRNLEWLATPIRVVVGEQTVNVRVSSIVVVIGAVIMLLLLNYFVNGTKIGRGIRAISQDQTTAGLMGINVNLLIAVTFFVGGALGGAAGTLFGINTGTVTPYSGFFPGLKAFTAAVLGGIGNVTGAVLGGLTLGLVEATLNSTLGFVPGLGVTYTDVFAFAVLILVLIFRPSGILGEKVDEKV